MLLPVPEVGTTSGPQYAQDINDSLSIIDQHDHSTGSGVPITPSGLDISSDLTMQDNNLTNIRTTRFQVQPSTLAGASDINCLYVSGVDLYYNDGSNIIRITTGGSVNAGAGSIGGLPSGTASVNYSGGVYTFESSTGIGGDVSARNVLLSNNSAGSHDLTLSPPNAMGADYTLVMPSLPVSQKIMTLDASGNITAPYVTDNSTIEVSANTIQVKAQGITGAQITNSLTLGGSLTTTSTLTVGTTLSVPGTSNLGAVSITGGLTVGGIITAQIVPGLIVTGAVTMNGGLTVNSGGVTISTGDMLMSNGTLTLSSSSKSVTIGGSTRRVPISNAAPSAGTNFTYIRGAVNSAGTKTAGEGFTSTSGSTGVYTITWSLTQAAAPIITATLTTGAGMIAVTATSTTTCTIRTYDTSGVATSKDFSFIAMGSL